LRFLGRVRPAVARVEVALADGCPAVGSGFLIAERVVATGRRLLLGDPGRGPSLVGAAQVHVWLGGGRSEVEAVVPHTSGLVDVALLRLASPAEVSPLRVGYPRLVRVGQTVWAVAPEGSEHLEAGAMSGTVNQFATSPGLGLPLFVVGFAAPPELCGAPLFNDLGEVVGLLAHEDGLAVCGPQAAPSCSALTAEALRELLSP
jgi:molecular chaperone DnaK